MKTLIKDTIFNSLIAAGLTAVVVSIAWIAFIVIYGYMPNHIDWSDVLRWFMIIKTGMFVITGSIRIIRNLKKAFEKIYITKII